MAATSETIRKMITASAAAIPLGAESHCSDANPLPSLITMCHIYPNANVPPLNIG